jgi:hypothetical protein
MNTGYNTDVRHQDVVFHVQTEDKGSTNPFIESLVYVGGQVLASKRASYASLLSTGQDEKAVVTMMDHQHRTMIAAIKHGKFDEKLQALNAKSRTGVHVMMAPPAQRGGAILAGVLAASDGTASLRIQEALPPPPPPLPPLPSLPPLPAMELPPVFAPPLQPRASDRSLDQVILEYLTSEADQEQLVLLLDSEPRFALGEGAALQLRTSSSKSGQPVSGVQVAIRMISTISEPRMLATGRTDDAGALQLFFQVPALSQGTAAVIITAASLIGRAELKYLL